MKVHHLKPAEGSRKQKIRVGRGESGHRGKTAGRGTKGQKARTNTRIGFEGGQTPLYRRLPKMRGFKNPFKVEFDVVNLSRVDAAYSAGDEVTRESLREKGLIRKGDKPIKVLGEGEATKALIVRVDAASKGAVKKIVDAGGSVETTIEASRQWRDERRTKRRKTAAPAAPAAPSSAKHDDAAVAGQPESGESKAAPDAAGDSDLEK